MNNNEYDTIPGVEGLAIGRLVAGSLAGWDGRLATNGTHRSP